MNKRMVIGGENHFHRESATFFTTENSDCAAALQRSLRFKLVNHNRRVIIISASRLNRFILYTSSILANIYHYSNNIAYKRPNNPSSLENYFIFPHLQPLRGPPPHGVYCRSDCSFPREANFSHLRYRLSSLNYSLN